MPEITEAEIERILAERAQGKLPGQIAREMNAPPAFPQPSAEDQAAAQGRRDLQAARSALNAEGAPPGQEPDVDPIEAATAAGHAAGGRGTETGFKAYVDSLFASAAAGDPRVVSQGTVGVEQREQWVAQARQRQVGNRAKSTFTAR